MRILTIFLPAVALCALAGGAAADDAKAVKRVQDLDRLAMEDVQIEDWASAQKELGQALDLVKSAKLDKHAVAVTTHIELGVVLGLGLKQNDAALAELQAALAIDPAATLPAGYDKQPELTALWDKAKAAAKPAEAKPADPNAPVTGIQHVPVDSAKEGDPIVIEAKVGADVKARKVELAYKPQNADDYTAVAMKLVKGVWRAEIPADITATDQVQYFIAARNAKAKVVASRGNATAPFVIAIARTKKATEEGKKQDDDDDENPLLEKNKKK